MEFCDFCENMLYVKCFETDDNEDADDEVVKYYCKNCDMMRELPSKSVTVFSEKRFDTTQGANEHVINPNIEYDHTIPHVNNIMCPNKACTKKSEEDNDVMFVKTDPINLSFTYYCVHCKHFWQNKN